MHIEAILESGSIRSASRRLFVSQPSLSQYVKRLEDTLGCPIFDRSKSPWTLTEGSITLRRNAGSTRLRKSGSTITRTGGM